MPNILGNLRLLQEQICDTTELEAESQHLLEELHMLSDMLQKCVSENARIAQDQAEYQTRYNELVSRYDAVKGRHTAAEKAIRDRQAKAERLEAFAEALESQSKSLTEFDEGLWGTLVDFMTVYSKEDISVTFKDGTEIHIG